MDVTYQVNRRKACDLCFLKKIKCDMVKPACSNCKAYQAECHTTRARKRYGSKKPHRNEKSMALTAPSHEDVVDNVDPSRMDKVELRLARIEEQMDKVFATTSTSDTSNQKRKRQTSPAQTEHNLFGFHSIMADDANQFLGQPHSRLTQPLEYPMTDVPKAGDQVKSGIGVTKFPYPILPTLAEMQPMIEHYFTHVNSLLPLFSEKEFARMLQEYYMSTGHQSRLAWAAVNVVLALGSRIPTSPSSELELGSGDGRTMEYINNAQSVMSEIVTRDVSLLGLQIVVGLIAILHTMKDPHPAVVLIGTAVRLAQRLHLHMENDSELYSSEEVLQRNRVFWLTYLFDRDISLRHHAPSLQSDADIGLDLPLENPADNVGYIYTKNGQTHLHYFRLRLQLAHIQGRVYELLFAIRANKIVEEERRKRVTILHYQLELWRRRIPPEMQASAVVEHVHQQGLFWMCLLHFSYLGCLVMIHGIWSHDAGWRQRLTSALLNDGDAASSQEKTQQPPPLPRGWKNCVQMSRHCMALIYRMPLSHCSVWANGCAYFSALIILEAHIFENPLHETIDEDLQLIDFAISVLNRMSDASTIMAMKRMHVVASELACRAKRVIHDAKRAAAMGEKGPLVMGSASFTGSSQMTETRQDRSKELQWSWNNAGVEAWPSMDVSLSQNYDKAPAFHNDIVGLSFDLPDEWS